MSGMWYKPTYAKRALASTDSLCTRIPDVTRDHLVSDQILGILLVPGICFIARLIFPPGIE